MEYVTGVISKQLVEVFQNVMHLELIFICREYGKKLSMTEVHTIAAIGCNELESMSEIAKNLHITMGTLTVAINNLVKKGYVERFKSEHDRRIVKVGLTKPGKKVYAIHEKFHRDLANVLVKDLGEDEKEVVVKAMSNLEDFIAQSYGE